MAQNSNLLITDSVIVTMDGGRRIFEKGAVTIEGDRIVDVGATDELRKKYQAARTINGQGKAILPGLVDLHFHTYLTRGVSDDLPLDTWLVDVAYPEIRGFGPEEGYLGGLISYCDAIKSGTTCVNDMSGNMLRVADAAEEIGIRATLSCFVADESENLETLASNEQLVREKHGAAGGRIRTRFGVEWAPIIAEEELAKIRPLADQYGVGIHIHLNESQGEVEMSKKRHGKRPVELAYDVGILGEDCVAAHCVWLTSREIKLFKETGTSVSHNPVSNGKLGSGISPVPELLAAGVNVGLGHDAACCNNARDMFQVMKWAALVHRAQRADPTLLPAAQVLEMATINGARALGLADEIGSIEKGKKADLILLDLDTPRMTPLFFGKHSNLISNIVYSAQSGDVDTVVIDGKVVMEGHQMKTVDETQLRAEVNQASQSLIGRLFGDS